MAGIFDHFNRPATGESEKTINPGFICGAIVRRAFGLSTDQQLVALINLELGGSGPMQATALVELAAIYNWVNGGTGTEGKASRLSLLSNILCMYEQSKPDGSPWMTETEARQALASVGVVFG